MKTRILASVLLVLALLTGCQVKDNLLVDNEVLIIGNEKLGFEPESGRSRVSNNTFEHEDKISFFSEGAFLCSGDILTFDGSEWRGENKFFWQSAYGSAKVHAYYPPIRPNDTLYDENHCLKDVLIAEGNYTSGTKIKLSFSHLYPEVVFILTDNINQQVKEIKFKVSHKVTEMIPGSAEVRVTNNKDEYMIFPKSVDGKYRLLVPYDINTTIELVVTNEDGTEKRTVLPNHTFRKGVSYRCDVAHENERVHGIFTTRDFIDFVWLYNGYKVKDRTLDEFYEIVGGKKVFQLRESLKFTIEDRKLLMGIGHTGNGPKAFADVFDGMHHTLSDIHFNVSKSKSYALFLKNEGTIRNLHIDNMEIQCESAATQASCLCDENRGRIYNCKVSNSCLSSASNYKGFTSSSFLTSVNGSTGLVYNCAVENCNSQAVRCGGLAYINDGILINNYAYKINFNEGSIICNTSRKSVFLTYGLTTRTSAKNPNFLHLDGNKYLADACFRSINIGKNYIDERVKCFSFDERNFDSVNYQYNISGAADSYSGTLVGALNHSLHRTYPEVPQDIKLSAWTSASDGHPVLEIHIR